MGSSSVSMGLRKLITGIHLIKSFCVSTKFSLKISKLKFTHTSRNFRYKSNKALLFLMKMVAKRVASEARWAQGK